MGSRGMSLPPAALRRGAEAGVAAGAPATGAPEVAASRVGPQAMRGALRLTDDGERESLRPTSSRMCPETPGRPLWTSSLNVQMCDINFIFIFSFFHFFFSWLEGQ